MTFVTSNNYNNFCFCLTSLAFPSVLDTVGWATGRASSL